MRLVKFTSSRAPVSVPAVLAWLVGEVFTTALYVRRAREHVGEVGRDSPDPERIQWTLPGTGDARARAEVAEAGALPAAERECRARRSEQACTSRAVPPSMDGSQRHLQAGVHPVGAKAAAFDA